MRPFFQTAFSNILKPCSYWSNRSVKPVRQKEKPLSDPIGVFRRQVHRNLQGNRIYYEILQQNKALDIPAQPYCRDARAIPCESGIASLIVTSPPYVTSYVYADLHQLTTLWYRYATTIQEFRPRFIGTASVNGKRIATHSRLADSNCGLLGERHPTKAREVGVYFTDMHECFVEMHRILRRVGMLALLLGIRQ